MNTFLVLLWKDLLRQRRNPWALVINLALPFIITALIGFAFGGGSSAKGMGTIKLAIVDEDDSPLSNFLRGAFQQGDAKQFLQPVVLSREQALAQINDNQLSAAVILPANFAEDFLDGRGGLRIELIKNPAQSFHPAIVEELLGVLVEGLNALALNYGEDLATWVDVFKEGEMPDFLRLSQIYAKLDQRVNAVKDYLSPPLVTYGKETRKTSPETGEERRPLAQVFAFMLPGMASMFLLFIADSSLRDLFREVKFRTLDRFRTMHDRLMTFILSKVAVTLVIVVLSGLVLFFVSAAIFQFRWQNAPGIAALLVAFSVAASGLLALLAAVAQSEKRAETVNMTVILGLSSLGGAFFPASSLPGFLHDHVSRHLPNYWFIEAVRDVHFNDAGIWLWPALKLAVLGVVFMFAAAALFRRQLLQGVKE
ncbi:MAG TPA: hypothetical protein DCY13_19090 [Verrucomicrobiales bacterium]|nr:hypothetical protein [Verrucomicrobiales bacterium]